MKKSTLLLVSVLAMLLASQAVMSQHYTDWTEFEYFYVTKITSNDFKYYELAKDYTINLSQYFDDPGKFPDCLLCGAADLGDWAMALPPSEWDFVRIEPGGILTVKKGFRWDGPSYPIRSHGRHNIRSSLVHDALYTLMRLDYMPPDRTHDLICVDIPGNTDGDYNRLMADMLIYMIAREDGQDNDGLQGAEADYLVLRGGAACATHKEKKIDSYQFHLSCLTAIGTDGKVELSWKAANYHLRDPNAEEHFDPIVGYTIKRDNGLLAVVDGNVTTYTDNTVVNGTAYKYQVIPVLDNKNQYDWTFEEYVIPNSGAGNALVLDGVDDYVEANLVSNDLLFNKYYSPIRVAYTVEGWIYPEEQEYEKALFAFNTIDGNYVCQISYNGTTGEISYWDQLMTDYVSTGATFRSEDWYHVAVTIDNDNNNNQGYLYVNGEQVATFSTKARPDYGSKFSIGQAWWRDVTSSHFKGMVDEVRIWRTARSQDEIEASMNMPLRGDEDDLMALWHFDEPNKLMVMTGLSTYPPGYVTKAFDASSNASDGTLMGYDPQDEPFVPSCAMNEDCATKVYVDIKPGSCENPFNAKSPSKKGKSVLPVAILGTDDLDVNDIDRATIELCGISPVRSGIEDVGTPIDNAEDSCACTEDEADGYDDLTLKFDRLALMDAINSSQSLAGGGTPASKTHPHGDHNNSGMTERDEIMLVMTGRMNDGTDIKGHDCVIYMTKGAPIVSEVGGKRGKIALLGSHPNPFNPVTTISYSLPEGTTIRLEIYNSLGQKVQTLVDGYRNAGYHTVEWNASELSSGIYFYRLESGDFLETKKAILLK